MPHCIDEPGGTTPTHQSVIIELGLAIATSTLRRARVLVLIRSRLTVSFRKNTVH